MHRVVFFDFDGTLGCRRRGWTGALHETLMRHHPELDVPYEAARASRRIPDLSALPDALVSASGLGT